MMARNVDNSDMELNNMKEQLAEFGLEEENLSKEEMSDLLTALNNSKSSITEELSKQETTTDKVSPNKSMKRRFLNVADRRMPWCILPSDINQAQKACLWTIYIKFMATKRYRQARKSASFAVWPPPLKIMEGTARIHPIRSTRSGRLMPVYDDEDDSSDVDFIINKTKKRKVSNCDQDFVEGDYTNKVISLKRKTRDDNPKPAKELRFSLTSNEALKANPKNGCLSTQEYNVLTED